jgi:hypothetical protein
MQRIETKKLLSILIELSCSADQIVKLKEKVFKNIA